MTIGYWSPMPPARTGVAGYSAALIEALRAQGHEVLLYGEGDATLYHAGNNALHAAIHERALAQPGAVLIHDAVLHHFYLGHSDEARYVEEFVHNYGEWNRGLAHELWRRRAASASDPLYFQYPMLKRIAETARLVIVHNPGAAAMVRAHAPDARIEELPHLFAVPPSIDPAAVHALRHQWNLPAGAMLFGVFGHLRESKRIHTVIAAARRTGSHLLVAGDFVAPEYESALDLTGVIRVPYLASETAFWIHAHAADACINLRFPTAGETSGIAIRLMGIGKPTILTAGLENSAYPDAACVRIDSGLAEEDMLAAMMIHLRADPAGARRTGDCGRAHILAHHAAPAVAARLAALLYR